MIDGNSGFTERAKIGKTYGKEELPHNTRRKFPRVEVPESLN